MTSAEINNILSSGTRWVKPLQLIKPIRLQISQSQCASYLFELSHPASCAAVPHGGPRHGGRLSVPSHRRPLAAVRGHTCIKRGKSVWWRDRETVSECIGGEARKRSTYSSSHRVALDTLIRSRVQVRCRSDRR